MKKDFHDFTFDVKAFQEATEEFRFLLQSQDELSENKDLLPLFRKHRILAAILADFAGVRGAKVAEEFWLFGEYKCDFAIADRNYKSYCLIEFEEAKKTSIFQKAKYEDIYGKKRYKPNQDWGTRFEHGFSQIIDWAYILNDQKNTDAYIDHFKFKEVDITFMLVIGRSGFLKNSEQTRLNWRRKKVVIDSQSFYCLTFDQALEPTFSRFF